MKKNLTVKVELRMSVVREDGKIRPTSFMTVYADNYDDALQALRDYREGKILAKDIPKTGLDVRTKIGIVGPTTTGHSW